MRKLVVLNILIAACWSALMAVEPVPFNGIVTDLFGHPLKGVKVYTLDRNFAAKSDKNGHFGLTNVLPSDTLHFVYKRTCYDVAVSGRKSMRVTLGDQVVKEAVEDVELVDLGYGFVKRRENITPTNGISGEVLRRTGQTNVLAALQGLVPGLSISTNSMGNSEGVTMRGIGTINGSTLPLYLVDGVEVNSLDFISIYDVESVEVMKEASIYGSRGANGAILVHTKRGKSK